MADTRTLTGSRDDLVADASRCLRMRYSESSCRLCVDICPHTAASLDGLLAINPDHCGGCLQCTAVCPTGALEQCSDFSACLVQLALVTEPVLGCIRTSEHSNANLACLGGLSEEHLVTLCHSLHGKLTLNVSLCSGCPNSAMIPLLRQRLEVLSGEGLLDGGCSIVMEESAHELNFRDKSIDRRSFFKSFGKSLFKGAAFILSGTNEPTERRTEYAGKRLPVRRELLEQIKNKGSHEFEVRIGKHFDSCISITDNCSMCQGCVATCPTGALRTEHPESQPTFDQNLCTGCGLCREFCLDEAVQISKLT